MPITRREGLTLLASAMLPVAAIRRARAADDAIELKVSHYLPPNHTFQKELTRWGDDLDRASGGRLKLRIYPASQLGPVNRQFDLARQGIADIAVGLHGATPGRYPMTELASLAFLQPKAGNNSAVTSRRLTELAPQYLAAEHQGLRILWMAMTNPLKMHVARKPIHTLAEFKGLRVRYAGVQFADTIRAVGAVPLDVPPAETTDSLAKGVIDAALFPYEATQSFELGDVVKYSIEPGVNNATFAVVMNPRKLASLPQDLQDLITSHAGPGEAEKVGQMFDVAEAAGREYMLSKHVEILTLPAEEVAKLREALAPLTQAALEAGEKAGRPARAFLAAYQA